MKSKAKTETAEVQLCYPECSIDAVLDHPEKEEAMDQLLDAMRERALWQNEQALSIALLGFLHRILLYDGLEPAIRTVETFGSLGSVIRVLHDAGATATGGVLEELVQRFPEQLVPDNLDAVCEAMDCMEQSDPGVFDRFGKRFENCWDREKVLLLLHKWVSTNKAAFPLRDIVHMRAQASLETVMQTMQHEKFWVNDRARHLGCFSVIFCGLLANDPLRAIFRLGENLSEALGILRDLGAARSLACFEELQAHFPDQSMPANSELEAAVEEILAEDPEFFSRFGDKLQACLSEDDVEGRLLKWLPANSDAFPTARSIELAAENQMEASVLQYDFKKLTLALAAVKRLSDKVKGKCS